MNFQASVHEPRALRYSFKRCDHGVVFGVKDVRENNLSSAQVQKKYPRLVGECPLGCGFVGVAYANRHHWWRFHNDKIRNGPERAAMGRIGVRGDSDAF